MDEQTDEQTDGRKTGLRELDILNPKCCLMLELVSTVPCIVSTGGQGRRSRGEVGEKGEERQESKEREEEKRN